MTRAERPKASELIADRGYDGNPFRTALGLHGIAAIVTFWLGK